MKYVSVRGLRADSGKILDRIEAGDEIVVTRNGKPFALLPHTDPADVEATLQAHRAARFGAALERIHAHVIEQGLPKSPRSLMPIACRTLSAGAQRPMRRQTHRRISRRCCLP